MDDTNLAYLCDDKMREAARLPAATIPTSCRTAMPAFINKVAAQKPAGMTLAVHLCRGNFKSTHAAAQGSYEPVAQALLTEMNVDAYFLEYDDAPLGRLQAAASSCPRARPSCSAWSPPSWASSRARTT